MLFRSTDSPIVKLTTSLFNGQNYLAWSGSVIMFLKGRGKMGYINGRIKAPNTEDASYDKWEMENSTIMTWICHSMIPEIGEGFLDMVTAQDIWETMANTYSRKGNSTQIFELRRLIGRSEQGGNECASVLHLTIHKLEMFGSLFGLQLHLPC